MLQTSSLGARKLSLAMRMRRVTSGSARSAFPSDCSSVRGLGPIPVRPNSLSGIANLLPLIVAVNREIP